MDVTIWLQVISLTGLLMISGGALWAGRSVLVSPAQAAENGASRYRFDTLEENLALPHVQTLIASSKATQIGLGWVAAGTVLQAGVSYGRIATASGVV
jgi:hypothetical protein